MGLFWSSLSIVLSSSLTTGKFGLDLMLSVGAMLRADEVCSVRRLIVLLRGYGMFELETWERIYTTLICSASVMSLFMIYFLTYYVYLFLSKQELNILKLYKDQAGLSIKYLPK